MDIKLKTLSWLLVFSLMFLLIGCSGKPAEQHSSLSSSSESGSGSLAVSSVSSSPPVQPWEKYTAGTAEWFNEKYIQPLEFSPGLLTDFNQIKEVSPNKIFYFVYGKLVNDITLNPYYDQSIKKCIIPQDTVEKEIEKYFGKFDFYRQKCSYYSKEKKAYITDDLGWGSEMYANVDEIKKLTENKVEIKISIYDGACTQDGFYYKKSYVLQGSGENFIFASCKTLIDPETIYLYYVDADTMQKQVVQPILINPKDSLRNKLNQVAKTLSQNEFNNLTIEVTKIKNYIATVNLKENPSSSEQWKSHRFQGSTGGKITADTLTETFLQRQYTGGWINAVQFLYEGKSDQSFDHMPDFFALHHR